MSTLSPEEYKTLSRSLAKKKFNVDKSKNAIKGFTSSGHLIVRDASGIVELIPPKYLLNIHQVLEDTENLRSEYMRLLMLYIAEAKDTGYITHLQSSRVRELFDLYEASSTTWKDLNDTLQARLTTSIDNISDLSKRYEDLTGRLEKEASTRLETFGKDDAAYKRSAAEFHRSNKAALQLTRQLDDESQKLTDDQMVMIKAPSMKREGVDLRDIRVKMV